jgi:putative DNA methylase
MVQDAKGGRIFLPASTEQVETAETVKPAWEPDTVLPKQALGFRVQLYGFTKYSELFTKRQLYALTTLCDLISELRQELIGSQICERGYADALTTYLACALSRLTDYCCSFATWNPTNENVRNLFQRQAIPMTWDFAEANPIHGKLSFTTAVEWVANSLKLTPQMATVAQVYQADATKNDLSFTTPPVISTDPPYYDNISYADLSDFFYTWLRPILKEVDPQTFSTLLTPKAAELVASPFRHEGSEEKAKDHFQEGFFECL